MSGKEMRLHLNENYKTETEVFRKSSNILVGYKLLKFQEKDLYSSLYHNRLYKIGEIYSSLNKSISIIPLNKEKTIYEINDGIFFYREIEESLRCTFYKNTICEFKDLYEDHCHRRTWKLCQKNGLTHYWTKFEINPKDLLTVGYYNLLDGFAATKAKFIEVYKNA